ncbi:MAG: hypothetical protein BGO49_06740 [Planctomycetales bacterium 71-10]|nr:MAG: hypothetical protein BGO49_06740 [Planctomycetales bacterium 71-10]
MRASLMSLHPIMWFALGAAISWIFVLIIDSPSISWSVGFYLGLGEFSFAIHGTNIPKDRPWPPLALLIPFGLGLLHAAPVLLGMVFAPRLATIPHETALVALAVSFAWVFAEPVAAARLTLRTAARP